MTSSANTIQLKGDFRLEEETASETITPGHLVEIHTSTGRKVRKHATEGGYAERTFAVEDPLQGQTATSQLARNIDIDYAADEKVQVHVVQTGSLVQAWLKAGEDVAIGDKLISAGDGTLIENGEEDSSTTVRQIIAIADEVLDLSASGAVATRIDVRVL